MKAGRKFWAVYLSIWTLFALVYAVVLSSDLGGNWWAATIGAITSTLIGASLGVGVWWLSGRLDWQRTPAPRFYTLHLILACIYSTTFTLAIYVRAAIRESVAYAVQLASSDATGWQLFSGLWLYGVLAGVFYVVRAEQRAHLHTHAALRALRAQLNPHFLFNALHTVAALIRRDPPRAEEAVERLGGLMRYVLDHEGVQREDVTLAQELAFVRDYLMLEQLRIGDRLRVVESIDKDAEQCTIPALTLQPLVENAVRHAVTPRVEQTTVAVRASVKGNRLHMTVEDDGPGAHGTRNGVGLQTVRQRLLVRFNGDAEFETRNGHGFSVVMDVPAI